jgi:hypothetical protein
MSISDCIEAYTNLSATVFAKDWTHFPIVKLFNAVTGRAWFDALVLKEAVRTLLVDKGLDPDMMLDECDPACKV